MIKKIVIATLAVILISAVGVGAYDAYQGNSTLEMPNVAALAAGAQGRMSQQGGQGQGQMGQQGGQGQMGQQGGQSQGQQGAHGAQGQTTNGQPVQRDWNSLTGTVIEMQAQGLLVETEERGQLLLSMGRPGFADEQGVIFNPGDTVTINGFVGDEGFFVAGDITNNATGDMLMLRDPNGRPLWAGPGRSGNGGNGGNSGGAQGQSRWQSQ